MGLVVIVLFILSLVSGSPTGIAIDDCYDKGFPVAAPDFRYCPFQQWLNLLQNTNYATRFYHHFAQRNNSYLFCSFCQDGDYLNFRKKLSHPNCTGDDYLVEKKNCSFPCFLDLEMYNEIPIAMQQLETGEAGRGSFLNEAIKAAYGVDFRIAFNRTQVLNGSNINPSGATGPTIAYRFPASFTPCNGTEFNASTFVLPSALVELLFSYFNAVYKMSGSEVPIEIRVSEDVAANCSMSITVYYVFPSTTPFYFCGLDERIGLPLCLAGSVIAGLLFFSVIMVYAARFLFIYNTSDIHSLPAEIAWSFLLYLKYPFTRTGRWSYFGTGQVGYYSLELSQGSPAWERVDRLFRTHFGCSHFDGVALQRIVAIYNPKLTSSFINKLHATEKRIEMNSNLFKTDFRQAVTAKNERERELATQANLLREWTYAKLRARIEKCAWNQDRLTPIVPFVHGTDYVKATCIATTGFASLSLTDMGYYGVGIYFTSSAFYSIPYTTRAIEPSMIVSWIIPGNTYPVIETPAIGANAKSGFSFLGAPLKKGFESHYVITALDGMPLKRRNLQSVGTEQSNGNAIELEGEESAKHVDDDGYYDEIVVTQENQILPAFIVQFDQAQHKLLFAAYKTALIESKLNETKESKETDIAALCVPRLRADLGDEDDPLAGNSATPVDLIPFSEFRPKLGSAVRDTDPLLRRDDRLIVNDI